MYTLSSWRSQLGSVKVDLLHQEPAETVGDPFTAHVPGEVTQVSKMTNVHPTYLEKLPGLLAVDLSHQEFARTVGNPLTAYVSGDVTQVSRMTNVHPEFLKNSPVFCVCQPVAPGTF